MVTPRSRSRIFFEKRLGQEVEADLLGDEFKGYVFKICGGNDKDGFPMKQGVFSQGRVRLLLSEGTSCYRPRRKGERKRKSVRGCIVGPDIRALSLSVVKKGDSEIPGLTDATKPRRRAPKTASGIRKLYNITNDENAQVLIKKHVVRRTFKSKKNPEAALRQKAPKIQRLVTDARLRRKKLIKKRKVENWKKSQTAVAEYHKLVHEYFEKKRKDKKQHEKAKADDKVAKTEQPKTTTNRAVQPTKAEASKVQAKDQKTGNKPQQSKVAPITTKVGTTTAPAKTTANKVPAGDNKKSDVTGAHVKNVHTKVVQKVVKK